MTQLSVPDTSRFLLFSAAALPIVAIDLRSRRIPDVLSLTGLALLLVFDALTAASPLLPGLLAAALAVSLFFALRAATRGLGLGDVKLAALVGLFVGPRGLIPALLVAALGGLAFAAYSILIRKRGAREKVPFAPFLVAGAYAAYAARVTGLETAAYGMLR
jgi:prepilin signal peptidase PulO-like enzyme (type II secretory pathway)